VPGVPPPLDTDDTPADDTPADDVRADGRITALLERQMSLWVSNRDDVGALADWAPDGVLTAPRGVRVTPEELLGVIDGWHRLFTDLRIELTSWFASGDRSRLALEWEWHVTRRSDGARSTTLDAIVVDLRDGRIVRWAEYFDTFGSVEFDDPVDT